MDAREGVAATPPDHPPALSVVVVIGAQRLRAAECLRALSSQTVADRLEVIVVDTRPEAGRDSWPCEHAADGVAPGGQRLVLAGEGLSYGEARAVATNAARAEVVAFVEDHCYPQPEWAEALLTAYADPVGAVGYAFSNANPYSLVSRIVHLATYGEWDPPAGRAATSLPGGNVSYRRDVLTDLGDELAELLTVDFNLHNRLLDRGLRMVVEPRAWVNHESPEVYLSALRGSFVYSRVLAAKRASLERWSARTRAVVAGKDLVGAPAARLARLLRAQPLSLGNGLRLAGVLPAIVLLYLVSAVGEAVGYLLGEGASVQRLDYWEVDAPRERGASRSVTRSAPGWSTSSHEDS